MEKEISSGTMLGIVLIALAAVIGLGFGVFSIAKGVANEGTVGVQDNLNVVSDSAYEDYNDKIITGTMVKSAVQNFAGKSVAILINTNAMTKGVKSYANHDALYVRDVNGIYYVNYGAIIANGSAGTDPSTVKGGSVLTGSTSTHAKLTDDAGKAGAVIKDGVLTISDPFSTDANGKVLLDNSVGGFSRTGNCEYISPSAKFEANLIKDTSGTTIGMIFKQMAK